MEKLARWITLGVLELAFLCLTSAGFAQEKHEKSAGEKKTVTGCLQKGDEAGEYSIAGDDGKTYGLQSKAVDLSKHVGHKVTVTGTMRAESTEKEKGEAEEREKKESAESAEAGDIRVTNLKMVSEKCQ